MDILLNGTNLPQSGTYTVLVKSGTAGETGTYNLTYVKSPELRTRSRG